MNDTTLSPSDLAALAELRPRFFRGLFLALLAVAALCGVLALLCGCASKPQLPPGAIDFVTNAAQRVVAVVRESPSHSQAENGESESDDPAPATEGAPSVAPETVSVAGPDSPDGEAPPSPVLVFRHGGFDGSKAAKDPATRIGAFKFSSSGMSYKWTAGDLGNWGLARTDAGALACAFYWSDKEQAWIGGKFDWISSSRLTRSWENVREHYNGGDPDAFFSAKRHAFCIVSKDGRKRTNLVED